MSEVESNKFVWVLEDEEELRNLYCRRLESGGYRVQAFECLADFSLALASLEGRIMPTAVLVDIHLPDGNLFQVTNTQPWTYLCKHSYVFVVSTADDPKTLRDCFAKGVTDYLTKPIKLSELEVKLERALAKSIQLDPVSMKLLYRGRETPALTSKEAQIISLFLKDPSLVGKKKALSLAVWPDKSVASDKTFDVHLVHIRKKLNTVGLAIRSVSPGIFQMALPD